MHIKEGTSPGTKASLASFLMWLHSECASLLCPAVVSDDKKRHALKDTQKSPEDAFIETLNM